MDVLMLAALAVVAVAILVSTQWATYGLTNEDAIGASLQVSADGAPECKPGGVTIDWDTVVAAAADITLKDGFLVKSGEKYLRYGQIITMAGVAEVQTYTLTGGPTAGSATISFAATENYPAESFAIAFDATAAAVMAAMQALTRFGPNGVTVARTGAGTAGDPYVHTATFSRNLGNVTTPTATHTYTGGTTPSMTIATTTAGVAGDKYGPYDPAATDGRQTRERGKIFILNESVRQNDPLGDNPQAIEGGLLWKARVLMTTGTASLAAGPTVTETETAFPRVRWADTEV